MRFEHLSVRRDDYSIQVMASGSARFFVRLDLLESRPGVFVFSDLTVDDRDDSVGSEALARVLADARCPSGPWTFVVKNILPSHAASGEHARLVQMHDRLVRIIGSFLALKNRHILNARLVKRYDLFDTEVTSD